MFVTFPDLHVTTEACIADGDLVVVRQSWAGTQRGAFLGIAPTNRSVSFTSMAMLRVAAGQIVEAWVNEDDMGLERQLGSGPPPADEHAE